MNQRAKVVAGPGSGALPRKAVLVVVGILTACVALAAGKPKLVRADLEVVDCLLPGQVRVLGNKPYQTQRRPVKTTASDCRIRGGEYVDFDRANLKTSLAVWLESAQTGDAEAQNTVGEIYERGLGEEPNYEAAVIWYQKAVDQGYTRAMFNLGALYDQGLGVPADKVRALDLYRQSWGLPQGTFVSEDEVNVLRVELEKAISEKDEQLSVLNTQLGQMQAQLQQLRDQLAKQPAPTAQAPRAAPASPDVEALNKQVESLKKWVTTLETERRSSSSRLAAIRAPTVAVAVKGTATNIANMGAAEARKALGVDFGRFYALVIGNQNYQVIDSLQTPISDAHGIAKLLKEQYGFSVTVLDDADDVSMLKALNDLNGKLKPEDNLLIYYAGHGARLQVGKSESGYWLPVNAEAPPQDTYWVQNEQITAHLARLPAKRVLVVADSCYAGLLSTDPSDRFVSAKNAYTVDYIKFKARNRSRLLLSSGGDKPVLDTGGGGNSVFARAFLEELQANKSVLAVPELFAKISKRVQVAAARNSFVQQPEFKSIKGAGHDLGDFFFVPKS